MVQSAAESGSAVITADPLDAPWPTKEQAIQERVYDIWEEEGRPEGTHLDHWRRAEEEINSADVEDKT